MFTEEEVDIEVANARRQAYLKCAEIIKKEYYHHMHYVGPHIKKHTMPEFTSLEEKFRKMAEEIK